jgi:hypothetical protein
MAYSEVGTKTSMQSKPMVMDQPPLSSGGNPVFGSIGMDTVTMADEVAVTS